MTREDINDIINAICPNDEDYEKPCISPKYLRQELEQLALDQKQWNGEPTTKNNLGVDCISKQAVLNKILKFSVTDGRSVSVTGLWTEVNELPPVTPQEPTDKLFSKADIDSIIKAVNEGWELRVNEVLDKIRAEIAEYGSIWVEYKITGRRDKDIEQLVSDVLSQAKKQVLDVIDKYKAESEGI